VIPTLETERLRLRAFRDDDLDAFAAIYADAEVMRFIGDGKPADRVGTWRTMCLLLGHWQLRGYGIWAAEEKETGALVGRIGLWNPEGWPGLEVGWLLARSYWGRGLATEGGRRALSWAFDTLGADHVISLIRPDNAASIRVAEKLGERREGTTQIVGDDALVYGIDRTTFASGTD
jgi:RimJ/RimL family protein N-acetyltransferase